MWRAFGLCSSRIVSVQKKVFVMLWQNVWANSHWSTHLSFCPGLRSSYLQVRILSNSSYCNQKENICFRQHLGRGPQRDNEISIFSCDKWRILTQGNLFLGSSLARSTVVTAVKFTIVDQPVPIDSLLKECIGKIFSMLLSLECYWIQLFSFIAKQCDIVTSPLLGDFLKTIQDTDLNVRRVALVMFNSAAHNKPGLIRGLLTTVLPNLYKETQIRKELIREVACHFEITYSTMAKLAYFYIF